MGQLGKERDGSVGGFGRREVVLTIGDYGALDDSTKQVPTLRKCKPSRPLPRVSIKHRHAVESDLVVVHVVRNVLDNLREEGWGRELGCALHIILHKDSMCNIECRQNLLACLMLIQGNEGMGLLHSAV